MAAASHFREAPFQEPPFAVICGEIPRTSVALFRA
jgi:hypothetical protein